MPEGPSIVILKDEASVFKGQKILEVSGNTSIDKSRLLNQKVVDFKSWGKHFLICFRKFTVRIHLLMFGSYAINERKERPVRLGLKFESGELNFYTCSVKILEEPLDQLYDWEVDTMADEWNASKVLREVKKIKDDTTVSDLLLNQEVFAGSGNIIKNEVLFRIGIHPETQVRLLPAKKKRELVDATRDYCFDFYEWKKAYVLAKHWLVYKKKTCTSCHSPITLKYTGRTKRRSFFCGHCQKQFS